MIKIIEVPIRMDFEEFSYRVEEEKLLVSINWIEEEIDFTGLPEGTLTDIEVDQLPINPVFKAEKEGLETTVHLFRFYNRDEREVFESGEN